MIGDEKIQYLINRLRAVYSICEKYINFRLLVAIVSVYLVFRVVVIELFLENISKKSSDRNVTQAISNIIKESKETANLVQKVTKSLGLEGVSFYHLVTKNKYTSSNQNLGNLSALVVKRNMSASPKHRFIPLCGSNVSMKVTARNSLGSEFASSANIKFKFGDLTLPVGLEKSIPNITTGYVYDAIVHPSEIYFVDPPSAEIAELKPKSSTSMVTYSLEITDIDQAAQVGVFEPRIFFIARGAGEQVFCDASIQAGIRVTKLDGSVVSDSDYAINIGANDIPHGLENILMRMHAGDKVSVMLDQDWLSYAKNNPSKIHFTTNEKYMIFDITVKNIKQSQRMFMAQKLPNS